MKSLMSKLSLCLLALCLSGCGAGGADPSDVVVGSRAPEFALTALDGTTLKSSSLKGEVVILNFWATWCGPCQSEIPELNRVAATSRARVVGIALDEGGPEAIRPYTEQHPINYTVLLGDQEVFTRFNGAGIPYTLVLDRAQRIVRIYRGPATRQALEEDLQALESGGQGQRAAMQP